MSFFGNVWQDLTSGGDDNVTPQYTPQDQVQADVAASGQSGLGAGTGNPAMSQIQNQVTGGDPSSGPGFWNQAWNTISGGNGIGGLTKNIAPLIAGGGLANALINGPGKIPQKGNIEANAAQLQQNAAPLISAENTGILPAGEETQVDQQLQAQLAQIKAKYASMGLSGSTMEQQDLANAQNQSVANRANLAAQATQEGLAMNGAATQDYSELATLQLQQQQDLQNQIAEMLQAFGGGQGRTNNNNQNNNLLSSIL